MDADEAASRLAAARVGRLATVRPDGTPHVVPFVFAIVEDGDRLLAYWAVDAKPKRSASIRRLENIRANPAVELVVDGYAEDWTRLWWVRAAGRARVVSSEDETTLAVRALAEKYPTYRAEPPPGPVIAIEIDRITGWAASA
jgi:PPOX class probable F420-dependent enzyme